MMPMEQEYCLNLITHHSLLIYWRCDMSGFRLSRELFEQSCRLMPGGVDSPVRAFLPVGGNPLFITRGAGSRIYDADGNAYIDYVCSWGPLILGHAHPEVTAGLIRTIAAGTSFGAPTERELRLAGLITEALPSVEKVRFVNSGTEATMSAIRLARAFTGREKIIKFAGCYHGHADSFLVQAGSGALTLGVPSSPGVPSGLGSLTIVLPYNDLDAVRAVLQQAGSEIAAVIVEPVAANMGVVPPAPGFLDGLRQLTRDAGSLLIFDEVITGFRLGFGGAQGYYGIVPDLTCLGKIVGGGLPVGAYGGKAEIMGMVAPEGPVYQAGTLSGNPVAMEAGIITLNLLKKPDVYRQLEEKSAYLGRGLAKTAEDAGVEITLSRIGSLMSLFFCGESVTDLTGALRSKQEQYARYFQLMLNEGIYLAPSQFEALFISLAHTREDLDQTIQAAGRSFMQLKREIN
jgi:glutamate-1-semialdehyde 2,1-aminomutase